MTKKKTALKTVLTYVQDETGSMHSNRHLTIDAFNEYFDTLKRAKKIGDVSAVVWQFSDAAGEERVRLLCDGPLADVPKLSGTNYIPRGNTPLLDAVGTAIQQAEKKKADRYLFIVQTDGLENASRDFTQEAISQIVADKEAADNWTVVFLGAGINEWTRHAMAMGVQRGSTMSYSPGDTVYAHASVGVASLDYLTSAEIKAENLAQTAEANLKKKKDSTSKE